MNRKLTIGLGTVALVVLSVVAVQLYRANQFEIPAVPMEKWRTLHVGMSTSDVARILGQPNSISSFPGNIHWWKYRKWYSVAEACVTFDAKGNMTGGTHDWD